MPHGRFGPIHARLPIELYRKVKKMDDDETRSISNMVCVLVQKGLDSLKGKEKPCS